MVLEPEREQGFLYLAREAPLRGQKQVFGQLLGDRTAALDDAAGGNIGEYCTNQPDRIDSEVTVETAILGRDYRLRQKERHFFEPQRLPVEVAVSRQQT